MEDKFLPARPIIRLLEEAGIDDWDSRVIYQLLEFQHATLVKLLEDCKELAMHRGKKSLNESDLRLTLELMKSRTRSKSDGQALNEMKRKSPLPPIKPSKKLRLPPEGLLLKDVFKDKEDIDALEPRQVMTSKIQNPPDYNIKKAPTSIEIVLDQEIEK